MSPIPIVVLAGSLGAGKTSLLRNLLEAHHGECHVIVNEIGKVLPGIGDFKVSAESTTVLGGGCACCMRRDDLVNDLVEYANGIDESAGAKVFLELSGVADPAPVLRTILEHPFCFHHFVVDEVITVVDALDATSGSVQSDLWRNQVVMADTCVYSKSDLVSPEVLAGLDDAVRAVNPWARCGVSDHGVVRDMVAASSDPQSRTKQSLKDDNGTAAHGVTPDVTLVEVGETFEWSSFGVWLSLLLHRWGAKVLRVKGVVPVGGGVGLSVNAVHHAVFPPEHVEGFPQDGGQLAFITEEMPTTLLERSLATFAALVQ